MHSHLYLQRYLPLDAVDFNAFATPLTLGWLGLRRYWRGGAGN